MTASDRSPKDNSPDDRDPAGNPPSSPPSNPPPAQRHPTGDPDLTGGWFHPGAPDPGAKPPAPPPLDSTMGKTPRTGDLRRPDLDEYGRPLPRRVTERDVGATRVTPRAFGPPRRPTPPPPQSPLVRRRLRLTFWGCLVRLAIAAVFAVTGLACAGLAYGGVVYTSIAATLPSVEDLQTHAAQFETTRIYDRDGGLLYEILDPTAGRRTSVPLTKISPYLVAATIAIEDREFYNHPGFDPIAIARAIWQNTQEGETVSGASTITQQLTRALLFDPEERQERTSRRKIREIILAAEITRRYTKDEILALYLNEIYYGNLAYGVEAAAETYFNTTADKLTLSQASFLAGLPQAPSVYDIYTNPEAALRRQQQVLSAMVMAGCLDVSNSIQPICVTAEQAGAAAAETANATFTPPTTNLRYPHWVFYVRSVLETQFDSQSIYRSGYNVYTTLSPGLQDLAQQTVADQVTALADKHVTDGALVAIQPSTGEILAMVGSKDFDDEAISGQVNMAVSPRQPGSAIKPLTYVAAFEKGWTPATLLWDVPSEFPPSGDPSDTRPPYKPENYDGKFHGPVLMRAALANSYNIPAVKALQFVGIYDDPATEQREGLIAFAERLGITTFTRPDYGLSLTLGGGEVPLVELTGAYSVFANGGLRLPPVAIKKITDFNGNTVYEYTPPPGEQVIRPEHAYLISNVLSDNEARTPAFGPNSALKLSFPAAVKTGTTNDYRDNWAVGYTPDLAVGVWVGNADFTPMKGTSGLTGAGPIWHNFMEAGMPMIPNAPQPFTRPPGVEDRVICAISGAEPSEQCPSQKTEIFASDQPPLPKENDVWQTAYIDRWTGLRASALCPSNYVEKVVLNIGDPFARRWVTEDPAGQAWAQSIGFTPPLPFPPDGECKDDSPLPTVSLDYPHEGETLQGSVAIWGRAATQDPADFDRFVVEYGFSNDPQGWASIVGPVGTQQSEISHLADWDTSSLPDGPATIRVVLFNKAGGSVEARIHVVLDNPKPTPALAAGASTPEPSPPPVAVSTVTLRPEPLPSPSATLEIAATTSP